jgi:hypothetical protein
MAKTALAALFAVLTVALHPLNVDAEPARAAPAAPTDKDGNWIIEARCHSLLCPVKHKQLIAHVRGGRLERLEGLPGTATGEMGAGGMVTITVKAFGVVAHVQGRVDNGGGAGVWSSNSLICSRGDWLAFPPAR